MGDKFINLFKFNNNGRISNKSLLLVAVKKWERERDSLPTGWNEETKNVNEFFSVLWYTLTERDSWLCAIVDLFLLNSIFDFCRLSVLLPFGCRHKSMNTWHFHWTLSIYHQKTIKIISCLSNDDSQKKKKRETHKFHFYVIKFIKENFTIIKISSPDCVVGTMRCDA